MITGSCHCGHVAFEIDAEIPNRLNRCTCSICARRGYLIAYYPPEKFRLLTPKDHYTAYLWRSRRVENNFCPVCGCSTYLDSPAFQPDGSWDGTTRRIGANARLFDGFDAADYPVTVLDGRHLW